jgi:tetratricopeptide (TPR) repeat protein
MGKMYLALFKRSSQANHTFLKWYIFVISRQIFRVMLAASMRRLILLVICISIVQVMYGQRGIQTDSLDRILRTIKNPDDKVDLILGFLKEPKNQYLEDSIGVKLSQRALAISQQTNYAIGKINSMLKLGNYFYRGSDYKKAMELAQSSKEMSEDLNLDKELANSLSLIGTIYTELGDYDNSSQYFFKSLKLFEKLEDKDGISHSLGNIGTVFFNQQEYKKALQYLNKALTIAIKINNQSEIKRQYNNIAAVYGLMEKFDTSIVFLRKALAINLKIGDKFGQAINIMNIGFNQMNKGDFDNALANLNHSFKLFTELENHLHMAECYLNFGFCYYTTKRIDKGADFFIKAINEGQKNGYYKIISTAAKMLNQIYTEKKDTSNAYKYLALEKLAGDSLFESKKQILISKFELQYINEKKEFERQQAQQTKNTFMLIVIFSLVSGIVILGLVFSRYRLKSKFVLLEKEKIESELKIKDRELTVNLISLIKKNEMLFDISNMLVEFENDQKGSESKEVITKIGQKLRSSTSDKMLNEFSLRFQEVHAGFYENLLKAYPDLSQNELKLCAFLRLNMSTKDISELTGQQLLSIDRARYRLRKKLGLSNSETNLVTFLSQM